ncbi:hypothetical protein [Siphonobacter sp. SORGH_AS_1065]|uniref:hypothetical protein n=1 Tax=Siphonobacter sp. SORGH_AS_1065 TaxID=3041795 RepID=UPI00278836FE|nr:hypothetical protein [Siphonobacter sp. SORGH_AS_1065]MDQ1085653.1 hypothetical protein [Siphonobacter sp. SORGH_AS_1065]
MIELSFEGEAKQLPENWQEVKPHLLPVYLKKLFVEPETQQTYHELLRLSLGYSSRRWRRFCKVYFSDKLSEETHEHNAEILQFLLGRIAWMWSEPMKVKPFDFVRINGEIHLLPDPLLKTLTYGELTDAYIHMVAYVKQLEKGDKRLNLLLATICRPKPTDYAYQERFDWNGDEREPYNEHIAEKRAEAWEAVSFEKKIPILLYFVSVLKELMETYQIYDTEAETEGEEEYPGQGFIKNQHLLAEKQIFGTMKQTRQANAHDVLLFLEESKKDEDFQEKCRLEAEKHAKR